MITGAHDFYTNNKILFYDCEGYINRRQERLEHVKEEVHRPVDETNVKRALHHEGFNYDDVTKVEKIDLFI